MKMRSLLACLLIATASHADTQLISQFTWESNPVTQADVGPDAIFVSSSAYSDAGGSQGNGLNAGLPKQDISLTLPGAYYNVDGIEVSVDYRRDESTGFFFTRGNSLKFGMSSGQLRVQYRLSDGNGSYIQHTYTNLYAIPNDGSYHHYTFRYDPYDQLAQVLVDGAVVWGKSETGEPLFWTSSGNMIIGQLMDGYGQNNTILDNASISEVLPETLPVDFSIVSVGATPEGALVKWQTYWEINNSHFNVETSSNGKNFEAIGRVEGAGNSTQVLSYNYLDETYTSNEVRYYRIAQVDKEGKTNYSDIIKLTPESSDNELISVYPNPITTPNQEITVVASCGDGQQWLNLEIYTIEGKLLTRYRVLASEGVNSISMRTGIYSRATYVLVVSSDDILLGHRFINF